jgi:hypothetical protein
MLRLLLLLPSCAAAASGAAATIEALLTDLITAASVCHDLRDNATGAAIRQLDVAPLREQQIGGSLG